MAQQMAHALKGSCATLGMTSLTTLFRDMESLAHQQDGRLTTKLPEAIAEYDRVLAALRMK